MSRLQGVPPASTTNRGIVELATTAEVLAGVDPLRVATCQALSGFYGAGGHVKNATRDLAAANGNQDITGFAFDPKSCLILAAVEGEQRTSWGFGSDTGAVAQGCIYQRDTGTMSGNSTSIITMEVATVSISQATITFIADGIRLAWVKVVDGPTGIAMLRIIGFR